jgi:hypothetical protein
MTLLFIQVQKLKQSYFLKPLAVVIFSAAMGGFSAVLPAQSDDQSSEMRDLVRQSQGLSPARTGADSETKSATAPSPNGSTAPSDPVAIYIQAGASAEQVDKIREIRKSFNKLSSSKATEIFGLYKEMRNLTTQAELDDAKILSVQEQINTLQANMAIEKTRTLIAIRKLLTPKQRENLVAIIRKRSIAPVEGTH